MNKLAPIALFTYNRLEHTKKTIEALGLKKIGQVVEKQDNAQMRGMIDQVNY